MTSNNASNVTKDIGDRVGAQASIARDTAKDLGAAATDTVHDFVARVSETTADLNDSAKRHLSAAAGRVSDHASDTLAAGKRAYRTSRKGVGRQVAKQPLEALMLAAAIGYLVGWGRTRS